MPGTNVGETGGWSGAIGFGGSILARCRKHQLVSDLQKSGLDKTVDLIPDQVRKREERN